MRDIEILDTISNTIVRREFVTVSVGDAGNVCKTLGIFFSHRPQAEHKKQHNSKYTSIWYCGPRPCGAAVM